MDILGQSKSPRCHGSLLRKRRHWPPSSAAACSAAAVLGKRHAWTPPSWQKVQIVGAMLVALFVAAPAVRAQANQDAVGAGTLSFRGESGAQFDAPRVHTQVRMDITGIIARVEVRQRFENSSDQWVEGVYAFPLPENAAVDQLRMTIGERVIVGEIKEKIAAQQLYEQAKAAGQRASLVQQHRANLFRTSVANVAPHQAIEVTMGYLQIVDQQDGRYSLRFPLTITPRYLPGDSAERVSEVSSETPLAEVSSRSSNVFDTATLADLHPALSMPSTARQSVGFDINIDAGAPIENVRSAYHRLSMARSAGTYELHLQDKTAAPEHDFELSWMPVVHGEPATALFRERTEEGEHVLLMFMPPQETVRVTTPREVTFIIDTSGSMGGESIEQARTALLNGLSTLKPADRFDVIQFNSTYEMLFPESVQASQQDLDTARDYVRALNANNGTEMLPALRAAMAMPVRGEYLRQIVFITDGAVGNEDELMKTIAEQIGNARLFTIGIGSAPNGAFMRKAAQMGHGTFTYIGSTSEVDERMSGLLRKLEHPVLTNIQLHWPAGAMPQYAPASIGDLYRGEPIVVTARVPDSLHGTLGVSGRTTTAWTRQLSLDGAVSRRGVATLWARRKVEDMMDLRASLVDETTIRSQVLPLALQYGLVTQYTSLIAVDQTPARSADELLASQRIANTKPQGSAWQAAALPKTATAAELQMLIGAGLLLIAACVRRKWTRT